MHLAQRCVGPPVLKGALKHSPQKLLFNALQYVYIYIYFKYFTSFNTALKSSWQREFQEL